jgi:hypothetical protein
VPRAAACGAQGRRRQGQGGVGGAAGREQAADRGEPDLVHRVVLHRWARAAPPSRSRRKGPCVNSKVGSPIGNRQPSLPISTRNATSGHAQRTAGVARRRRWTAARAGGRPAGPAPTDESVRARYVDSTTIVATAKAEHCAGHPIGRTSFTPWGHSPNRSPGRGRVLGWLAVGRADVETVHLRGMGRQGVLVPKS